MEEPPRGGRGRLNQERSSPRGMVRWLDPDGRVLRQELLHTGFRRRQGRAFLPLRDELGVGEQPHQFLRNRERMRRIVARQNQARRLTARHEGAVHAIDEARAVQVLVEGIQHLLGGLRVVLQGLGPRLEVGGAGGRHGAHPPDGLGDHGAGDAPLEWLLYSEFAVVVGYIHLYTLCMIVPIFNAMMRMDRALLEAAGDSGATEWQTLWHVIVPLCKPG